MAVRPHPARLGRQLVGAAPQADGVGQQASQFLAEGWPVCSRDMYWGHRADYVATDDNGYKHFNKLDSGEWNTLRICFLPARYTSNGNKCMNAYLHTQVNASESFGGGFQGEIKSGTRSSRHTSVDDPEPAVYKLHEGDKKIRLLGHWGSTVHFRNVRIRSVGSIE